jgi:thiamine biosynthesis lipoprotein
MKMGRLAIVWVVCHCFAEAVLPGTAVAAAGEPGLVRPGLVQPGLVRFEKTRVEMAVPVRIVLYASDAEAANRAAEAALAKFHQLNDILSDYDPQSELRQLCLTAGGRKAVPVSDDLWTVLCHAQCVSKRSGGAFDVTVGPVVRLWRQARRTKRMPSPERLDAARATVGYRLLWLDPRRRTVELKKSGMRLDLGGIAKGYAVDEALRVLREHGITRALVDAGGDIGLGDPPPGRPGWLIGVARPRAGAPPERYLWLSRVAIATSGDTRQFVKIDGRRYSHIVDPRSGLGLTDHGTVTVIAPKCITADSLASAVSVLGPKPGFDLIEATPEAAALVLRTTAAGHESHESCRWKRFPVAKPETSGKRR